MISDIPSGILTCTVDGEETGILEISPEYIKIRLPERLKEEIKEFQIYYYNFKEDGYSSYRPKKIRWEEGEAEEFYNCYIGNIEDPQYRQIFSFVSKQYYDYIVLKSESYGSEFSEELVGYPAEKDEIFAESYEQWKQKRLEIMKQSGLIEKILALGVEVAVSLENPTCYKQYLADESNITDYPWTFSECSREERFDRQILEKAARLYIGNQFCHNLFPKKELLYPLLEKAKREGKAVSLAFTYLREELREETEDLLEELYQWSQREKFPLEIVVNDLGMCEMLQGKEAYFKICYGTLLNKRRKDPRYRYKKGYKEKKSMLAENSLNVENYREFLKNMGVVRYEYECCGYPMKLAGQVSLHLPMYKTNTSQYCTLYALCAWRNRGRQKFVKNCPEYCSSYVCMYPEHLHLVGKYNSIFALDMELLADTNILDVYKKRGMDRVVWNFV